MNRRDFLCTAPVVAAGLVATPTLGGARPRVVVVGAGFGGASFARYMKQWSPWVEVTVVEPNPLFTSCPMSNTVLAGMFQMADITFPYRYLQDSVDRFIRDRVIGIDASKRTVTTSGGQTLAYDRLVLAGGVELMFDRIQGYDASARERVKHAWQAGTDQTGVLRRQLQAMPNGGVFVISMPMAPLRCPPAPYERVCLVADYFKRAKPRSKIILLDANPDLISKKALFLAAWQKHYGHGTGDSMIEYRANNAATELDVKGMRVLTEFDEVKGDVINLVPPMRAAAITAMAGARTGDGGAWCPVHYPTLESTEIPNVHILGDSMLSNLSKAAALANNSGKLCAYALGEIFAGRSPDPTPVIASTCYSASTSRTAFHVASVFRLDPASGVMELQKGSGVSERETEADLNYMRGWARNIWADTLGLPGGYRFGI